MQTQSGLITLLLVMLQAMLSAAACGAEGNKPHVVIVVGTHHYSPHLTMPIMAKELERLGFRTTVVMGKGDPERKTTNVLPNIKALNEADLAIFFMRFLKLPDEEWKPIEAYLKSGKPVIGLRTANHSFKYPQGHPRAEWNDGFGRRALGTPYIVHQKGKTDIRVLESAKDHPIMKHLGKTRWVSPGTLYLTRLDSQCTPLVQGTGEGKPRTIEREYGTVDVKAVESDIVAWTWENEWGGKVFATSFGHPGDFEEPAFMRLLINSVYWALESPIPGPDLKIPTWKTQLRK